MHDEHWPRESARICAPFSVPLGRQKGHKCKHFLRGSCVCSHWCYMHFILRSHFCIRIPGIGYGLDGADHRQRRLRDRGRQRRHALARGSSTSGLPSDVLEVFALTRGQSTSDSSYVVLKVFTLARGRLDSSINEPTAARARPGARAAGWTRIGTCHARAQCGPRARPGDRAASFAPEAPTVTPPSGCSVGEEDRAQHPGLRSWRWRLRLVNADLINGVFEDRPPSPPFGDG
jgi:hypothetical protein